MWNDISRKEILKTGRSFYKACKRSLSSLFSYAFVFPYSNSTETIYTPKIEGYR